MEQDTSEPNTNDIRYYLENKAIFKEQFKQISNSKHIKIKWIIVTLIMVTSIGLGLAFAAKDIFLISSLFRLFGQHIVAFNVLNLIGYIIGGGILSSIVSFVYDKYNINKTAYNERETINPILKATKTAEIIIMPLVYALRDLSAKSQTFENFTEVYKSKICKNLMMKQFGYSEKYTNDLFDKYYQIDQEELARNIKELDSVITVKDGNKIRKLDLSYMKKMFHRNFSSIFKALGNKEKNELVKEEEKIITSLLKGKEYTNSISNTNSFPKVKNKKSNPLDYLDNPVKKYIKIHDEQSTDDISQKKTIEITD